MTATTPNLSLPYIKPGQAQKHVTHNEAIRRLDAITHLSVVSIALMDPPTDPLNGARYGAAVGASGAWAGHAGQLAVWQDGAWTFLIPQEGWTLWVQDQLEVMVYSGEEWVPLLPPAPTGFENLEKVGVNASADTENRLSVASAASLFSHEGQGHQLKVNKNTDGDTASLVMQTGFSGRAEIGLIGDDKLSLKTSVDGVDWTQQLCVDPAETGVCLPLLRSGRIVVGSDSVENIVAPAYGGIVAVTVTSALGYPQANHSGLFAYDVGASLALMALTTVSGLVSRGTSNLTGTTGAVDQSSISVQPGVLQIENRYIAAREFSYTFLC